MPVYNGEPYLQNAIESVLAQTMTDFDFIISDNASDDATQDICQAFAKLDKRIRYFRNQDNLGAASNYNRVFELSSGDYFRWANADDLCEPTLHQKCSDVLDHNPNAVLTYGKTSIINESGDIVRFYDDELDLQQESAGDRFLAFLKNVGLTNAIYGLMRKDAMQRTNLFGDGSVPSVDIRFMSELTLQGKFIEIPEVLFYRRMHADAYSTKFKENGWEQQFWQGRTGAFKIPTLRLNISRFKSVWQAPIALSEKLRLTLYIVKWLTIKSPKIISETCDYIWDKFQTRSGK